MNSGGHSDEPDMAFHRTVSVFVDALLDDITALADVNDDDPFRVIADHVILIKQRAVDHLRGFLPTDPPSGRR